MNLIEQLGGYAKASRELELKEQNSVFQCCIAVDAEMIREALLQYRRENNIFEVGDWVGIKDGLTTWIDKIVSIETKSVFNSQWNKENVEILIFEDGTKLDSGWAIHTTDEEIKAGRRLWNTKLGIAFIFIEIYQQANP